MKLCFEVTVGGLPIKLEQSAKGLFTVTYYKQVTRGLDYEAGCNELGACIFHALACDSKLDNEGA